METAVMRFSVSLEGMIIVPSAVLPEDSENAAAIESHLDDVMVHLDKLKAADSTIELDLTNRSVRFEVAVEALNPVDAINIASGQIRSAIHAAGGATPDWPKLHAEVWGVRLVGASSSELVEA